MIKLWQNFLSKFTKLLRTIHFQPIEIEWNFWEWPMKLEGSFWISLEQSNNQTTNENSLDRSILVLSQYLHLYKDLHTIRKLRSRRSCLDNYYKFTLKHRNEIPKHPLNTEYEVFALQSNFLKLASQQLKSASKDIIILIQHK